jgi:hypothetical protein
VLQPTRIIVIRGAREALRPWQQMLSSRYLPDAMALVIDPVPTDLPGVLNKPVGATVNAYLCRGVICLEAIGDIQALLAKLESG